MYLSEHVHIGITVTLLPYVKARNANFKGERERERERETNILGVKAFSKVRHWKWRTGKAERVRLPCACL